MAVIVLLILTVPLLVVVVRIRLGRIARRDGSKSTVEFSDPLGPIDHEIANLEDRLDEFDRTGGSGTWMAFFAASYRRRRVEDLKRQRRWHLGEASRWWLRRENPAAVRLPQARGCASSDIQKSGRG
jgi:hypothetical protein